MDKALKFFVILMAWTIATRPVFPQILTPIMQKAPSVSAAACGSSITGVLADYWAGSLSTSPITTNWADSNGGGNALGPTASPTWSGSTFGSGLAGVTLNGSSQYFSMTTAQIPASSFGNLSFYAIVKPAATSAGALTSNHNYNSGTNATLTIQINGTGHLELDKQNVAALCTSSTLLSSGTIYEIYFDYNGTTCHLYINGTLDTTNTNAQTISVGIDRFGTNNSAPSTPNAEFNGSIYEAIFSSSTSYQSGAHTCWTALGLP